MSARSRTGAKHDDKFFTWDWRDQPDMNTIALAVWGLSGGKVYMTMVDTGTDSYVLAVTDRPLSSQQATRLWERTL